VRLELFGALPAGPERRRELDVAAGGEATLVPRVGQRGELDRRRPGLDERTAARTLGRLGDPDLLARRGGSGLGWRRGGEPAWAAVGIKRATREMDGLARRRGRRGRRAIWELLKLSVGRRRVAR